jgi:hypothetical protein
MLSRLQGAAVPPNSEEVRQPNAPKDEEHI